MFLNECRMYKLEDLIVSEVLDKDGNPDRNLNPGDYVRHFKGNIYRILGSAKHTESEETLVIYESVTAPSKMVYARPLSMFISEVDHEKYPDVKQRWRLEKVSIVEKQPDEPTNTLLEDGQLMEITYSRQTELLCSKTITEFLSQLTKDDELEVYSSPSRSDILRVNPSNPKIKKDHFPGIVSSVSLEPAINPKDGLIIKFTVGKTGMSVTVSLYYGDVIYRVGSRMVIFNSITKDFDFFNVIKYND